MEKKEQTSGNYVKIEKQTHVTFICIVDASSLDIARTNSITHMK